MQNHRLLLSLITYFNLNFCVWMWNKSACQFVVHMLLKSHTCETHTHTHIAHTDQKEWMCEKLKLKSKPRNHCITPILRIFMIACTSRWKGQKLLHTQRRHRVYFSFFFLVKKTTPTITNVNCLFFCAPRRDDKNGKIRYGYAATKPISIRTSIIYHFICLLTSFDSLRCLHFHHKHSTTTIERDSKQTNKNNLIKTTTFNVKWNWTNTLLSERKLHVKSSSTDLKQNEEGGEVVVVIVVVTIKN